MEEAARIPVGTAGQLTRFDSMRRTTALALLLFALALTAGLTGPRDHGPGPAPGDPHGRPVTPPPAGPSAAPKRDGPGRTAGAAVLPGRSREEMFGAIMEQGRAALVLPAAPAGLARRYAAAADAWLARPRGLFRRLTVERRLDAAAPAESLAAPLVVVMGTPASNRLLARLAPHLPVTIEPGRFRFLDRTYDDPRDLLVLAWPNPEHPDRLLLVITAASDSTVLRSMDRAEGRLWQADYTVWRGDDLLRRGVFREAPGEAWAFDETLDEDRLGWRERFEAGLTRRTGRLVTLELPRGLLEAAALDRLVATLDERLGGMAATLGLPPDRARVTVRGYPDYETKGKLTGRALSEDADVAAGVAHRVFDPARPEGDGLAEAEILLARAWGETSSDWLAAGSEVWLAGRWMGVPVIEWPARLAGIGGWLPAPRLIDEFDQHSCYFTWPAAGAAVAAFVERKGVAALRELRRSPDALDRRDFEVDPPAPSSAGLPRWIAPVPGEARPRQPRPAAGTFLRGLCYAHDYSLDAGYMSRKSLANLAYLRDEVHANAVAISPFGYIRDALDPAIVHPYRLRGQGSESEENDESLVVAVAQAHALGLSAVMAPHLWGRVWCGEWRAADEAGWPRLFDEYRRFILHYAALAEMTGCEWLQVGKELGATSGREAEWRALIAGIRKVYRGRITYGANWDGEYGRIAWWDAVDAIGVSQYTPLSEREEPPAAELTRSAAAVADSLDRVSARFHRPYLLTEVGFVARSGAARRPWESDGDAAGAPDPELQARCYDAVLRVFGDRPECAGMFWWKWFTHLASNNEGRNRWDYPPYGKPAEGVLSRWYQSYQAR